MSLYTISATTGQWLRATLRTATESDVEDVLRSAMAHLGYHTPFIEWIDGGDVYAYADEADWLADLDDSGPQPKVVASRGMP